MGRETLVELGEGVEILLPSGGALGGDEVLEARDPRHHPSVGNGLRAGKEVLVASSGVVERRDVDEHVKVAADGPRGDLEPEDRLGVTLDRQRCSVHIAQAGDSKVRAELLHRRAQPDEARSRLAHEAVEVLGPPSRPVKAHGDAANEEVLDLVAGEHRDEAVDVERGVVSRARRQGRGRSVPAMEKPTVTPRPQTWRS